MSTTPPAEGDRPLLETNRLCKSFGETVAVDDVSLAVAEGEIVCLLGPSGCGKTTLLRLIAGLETADRGSVRFAGRDMAGVPVHRRGFGLMFQENALFPHKNVTQNVAFGLRMADQSRPAGSAGLEMGARVREVLELVGLTGMGQRQVQELSGGEQQRVALARSLAPSPRLLLLDEPLGSLDRALRERLMNELRSILKRVGVTAITVTHDQQEAFALADKIVVMEAGRALQTGSPEQVYRQPASPAVARFLGLTNLLEAHPVPGEPRLVHTAAGRFPMPVPQPHQSPFLLLIRPEAASTRAGRGTIPLQGRLTGTSFRGRHYQIEVAHPAGLQLTFTLSANPADLPAVGDPIHLHLDPTATSLLPRPEDPSLITVHKLDAQGRPVVSYSGRVLSRSASGISLAATFRHEPVSLKGITLQPGDRFVEHFFADRWYSIFEVYDGDDGRFKGWYCNLSRPAAIAEHSVSAEDLALDLLVEPDGRATTLDREEFEALALSTEERQAASRAFEELQALAESGRLPRTR